MADQLFLSSIEELSGLVLPRFALGAFFVGEVEQDAKKALNRQSRVMAKIDLALFIEPPCSILEALCSLQLRFHCNSCQEDASLISKNQILKVGELGRNAPHRVKVSFRIRFGRPSFG